jgi:hypothetical protein
MRAAGPGWVALACALALPAAASDRHEGYYYPKVTSTERFERVMVEAPPASRDLRVEFITGLTAAQLDAPANPRFVFFAKGTEAQDLILVALDDDVFATLYRARAVLAQMTSNLRSNIFFREQDLHLDATFYDMLQFLDFETLVISDGEDWSHRVEFIRE